MDVLLPLLGQLLRYAVAWIPLPVSVPQDEWVVKFRSVAYFAVAERWWWKFQWWQPVPPGPKLIEKGLTFYLPLTTTVRRLPKQLLPYNLEEKPVTTADGRTVSVDGVIVARVVDPLKLVMAAEEGNEAGLIWSVALPVYWNLAASSTLGNLITDCEDGTLQDLLKRRIETKTQDWGIEIVEASLVASHAYVCHLVGKAWGGE